MFVVTTDIIRCVHCNAVHPSRVKSVCASVQCIIQLRDQCWLTRAHRACRYSTSEKGHLRFLAAFVCTTLRIEHLLAIISVFKLGCHNRFVRYSCTNMQMLWAHLGGRPDFNAMDVTVTVSQRSAVKHLDLCHRQQSSQQWWAGTTWSNSLLTNTNKYPQVCTRCHKGTHC